MGKDPKHLLFMLLMPALIPVMDGLEDSGCVVPQRGDGHRYGKWDETGEGFGDGLLPNWGDGYGDGYGHGHGHGYRDGY